MTTTQGPRPSQDIHRRGVRQGLIASPPNELRCRSPRGSGARIAVLLPAFVALVVLLFGTGVAYAQQAAFVAKGATGAGADGLVWGFRILAGLTLVGALGTVLCRNPVVASLALVATLFCVGGLFLLLHASFLAAIQILVYAGAVMVLFVFVVMSVGHPEREELGLTRGFLSKAVGLFAIAVLLSRLLPMLKASPLPQGTRLVADSFGDVRSVGQLLFDGYLFPFEALSLLLLAAIVGAVMVSRRAVVATTTGSGASNSARSAQ